MSLSTRTKITIEVALKCYRAYTQERADKEPDTSVRPGYWTRRLQSINDAIDEFEQKGGDE